jgi:hypothetical protein
MNRGYGEERKRKQMITIYQATNEARNQIIAAIQAGTPVAWSLPGNTGIIFDGEAIYFNGPNVADVFEPFSDNGILVIGSNIGIAATLPDVWNGQSTQEGILADDFIEWQLLATVI